MLVFLINKANKELQHFRPVIDGYIHHHFSRTQAHTKLVNSLMKLLRDGAVGLPVAAMFLNCGFRPAFSAQKPEASKGLNNAVKALEYLSKFIVQSRVLMRRQTHGADDSEFKKQLLVSRGGKRELTDGVSHSFPQEPLRRLQLPHEAGGQGADWCQGPDAQELCVLFQGHGGQRV